MDGQTHEGVEWHVVGRQAREALERSCMGRDKLLARLSEVRSIYAYLLVGVTTLVASTVFMPAIPATALNGNGLVLAPLRTELDLEPGTSTDLVLTIENAADSASEVRLSAESFTPINAQYDYAFDIATETARWVRFAQSTITLAAGKTRDITYTVGIPLDAEAGGKYLSVFASSNIIEKGTDLTSRQRVGSLLYINVAGEVTRPGELIGLNSPFLIAGDSQWSMSLGNGGTTHYRSRYNVSVQQLFGEQVIASSGGDALILPGTVRTLVDSLPAPKLPGIYKLVYTIGLGDTPAVKEVRYVLYVPPAMAMVLLLGLTLGISLLVQKKRRKKS